MDTKTFLTILHLFGVALGAGGAYMTDGILLAAIKDHKMTDDEFAMIRRAGVIVTAGLALLILSGIGLFLTDPNAYLASSKFIAKMIVVLILTVNGVVLHFKLIPLFEQHLHKHLFKEPEFVRHLPALSTIGAVSFTSWTFALVMGGIRSSALSVAALLGIYAGALLVIATAGYFIGKRMKHRSTLPFTD